jgi:hypothetical protein
MRYLLTFLFLLSGSVFAEVSREEASSMIDQMVKSNMISAEEAMKAKARLGTITTKEWKTVNSEAEHKVARMPASVAVGDPSKDLTREQFSAIEDDLKNLNHQ